VQGIGGVKISWRQDLVMQSHPATDYTPQKSFPIPVFCGDGS